MHLNFPVSLDIQMVVQAPEILLQYAVDIAQEEVWMTPSVDVE